MGSYANRLRGRVKEVQGTLDEDREGRNERKKRSKEYRAFLKLPGTSRQQIWCRPCRKDFVTLAWKEWSPTYGSGSWFTRCPDCGGECARYISNKLRDPYYEESDALREMRGLFAKDTLQPHEYGFRTLYGEPFKAWEEEMARRDEEIRAKYAALGIKGETFRERTEREEAREALGFD